MSEPKPRRRGLLHELQAESMLTNEQRDLSEIRRVTFGDTADLKIFLPQQTDSLGSDTWRTYLDRKKLLYAWSPPEGSPYTKFLKTKTINSIDFVASRMTPRYSDGERKSEHELTNVISSLDATTAVVLNSGGAHSVAIAAKLAKYGYQPVIMFDSVPHSRGVVRSEQDLATLLYFAQEMEILKREGGIQPSAPPVFVLDAHRDDMSVTEGNIVNNYTYTKQDFPSSRELRSQGITKVIYLNESDENGVIGDYRPNLDDLEPIVEEWTQAGIELAYTGIAPFPQDEYEALSRERFER